MTENHVVLAKRVLQTCNQCDDDDDDAAQLWSNDVIVLQ